MAFESDYLNNKIKGSIAEQIFELLHMELDCQVFRTGQEFLYPHLFNLARIKKKQHHQMFKEDDLKHFLSTYDGDFPPNIVGMLRFDRDLDNKRGSGFLASSPDFTIVTPAGNIEQFEVKFRANGVLESLQEKKYAKRDIMPFIFLCMAKEPFIKILSPAVELSKGKRDIDAISKLVDAVMDIQTRRDCWHYEEEVVRNGGNIILPSGFLESDNLVYPKKILDKYKTLIKKWYPNKE